MKQDNIHIQTCFFKINVLSDDNVNFTDTFNENFNDTNAFNETFNDEKSLKNQFVIACAQNEKYQQILKAFQIEKRTLKIFFLIECTIINDQIQYRIERTIINFNIDFIKYSLNNKKLLIFNNDELRLRLI